MVSVTEVPTSNSVVVGHGLSPQPLVRCLAQTPTGVHRYDHSSRKKNLAPSQVLFYLFEFDEVFCKYMEQRLKKSSQLKSDENITSVSDSSSDHVSNSKLTERCEFAADGKDDSKDWHPFEIMFVTSALANVSERP